MVSTRASNVKGQNEQETTYPDTSQNKTPITSNYSSDDTVGTTTEHVSNSTTVSSSVPNVTTTVTTNASDITNAGNPKSTSSNTPVTMNTISLNSTITDTTNSRSLATIGAVIGAMRISMDDDDDGSEITTMTTPKINQMVATTTAANILSGVLTTTAPRIDPVVTTTATKMSSHVTNMTTTISSVATSMAASVGSDVTAAIPGTYSGARTTTAVIGSCATTMTTKIISVATTATTTPFIPTTGTISLTEADSNGIRAAISKSPSTNIPNIDVPHILTTLHLTSSNVFNKPPTTSNNTPSNSNNVIITEMECSSNEFTSVTKAISQSINSSAPTTAVNTISQCSPATTTVSKASTTAVSILSSSTTDTVMTSGKISTNDHGNKKETSEILKDATTTNKTLEAQCIPNSSTLQETTSNNKINIDSNTDKNSIQNENSSNSSASSPAAPAHSKIVQSSSNKNGGQDCVTERLSTDVTPTTIDDDDQNTGSPNTNTFQNYNNLKGHERVFVSLLKYFCPTGEANDPSIFTDVTFFTNDGHSISANKIILFLVCPFFNDMFHKLIKTQKDFGSIVVCTDINFCNLKTLFELIYTGTINPLDNSDEFRKIVKKYGMGYCELGSKQSTTVENEISGNGNSEAGTSTTNSNPSNDKSPTSIGELAESVQTLKWTGWTKCVPQESKTLYQNQTDGRKEGPFLFTDVILASRTGQFIAANSFVLVLSCPYFRKLFTELGESKPERKITIVFDDIEFCHLRNLVRLIYVGECSVNSQAEVEQFKNIISSRFGMEDICIKDDCTGSHTIEIVEPSQNLETGNAKLKNCTKKNQSETNATVSGNAPAAYVNHINRRNVEDSTDGITLNNEASLNDDINNSNDEEHQNCINSDNDVNKSGEDGEGNDAWSESIRSENDWIISNRTARVNDIDKKQRGTTSAPTTRPRYEWKKITTPSKSVLERDWRRCRKEQQARIERIEYYCAYSPKHKCPAKLKSHTFPNNKIVYFANNEQHANHRAIPPLTIEQSKFAEKCVDEGTCQPRFVYALMQLEGLGEPNKSKLISKLKRYKREIRAVDGNIKKPKSLVRPNIRKGIKKPVKNSTRRIMLQRLAKNRNSTNGGQVIQENVSEKSTGKTNKQNSQTNRPQIENGQSSQSVKRKLSKTATRRGNAGRPKTTRLVQQTQVKDDGGVAKISGRDSKRKKTAK